MPREPKIEPEEAAASPRKAKSSPQKDARVVVDENAADLYPECLADSAAQLEEGAVDVDNDVVDEQPSYFTHKDLPHNDRPVFRQELDEGSILNAHIDDEGYIDTVDLAQRILFELKQYTIPQTIFAEKILCRSQGTLSDLLRNPRPWTDMKSGKETYRRMFNWLQQPLHIRLSILDLYDLRAFGAEGEQSVTPLLTAKPAHSSPLQPSTSAQKFNSPKRQRFTFTERQKSTLMAIFRETPRVSKELQDKIADKLGLDPQTVANFFMNARRRRKIQKPRLARPSALMYDEYGAGYDEEQIDVTSGDLDD